MPKLGLGLSVAGVAAPQKIIWKVAVFGAGQITGENFEAFDFNQEYVWDGSVYQGSFGVGPDSFVPNIFFNGFSYVLRYDGNPIYSTPSLINQNWDRVDNSGPFAPIGNAVSYEQNSFINYIAFGDAGSSGVNGEFQRNGATEDFYGLGSLTDSYIQFDNSIAARIHDTANGQYRYISNSAPSIEGVNLFKWSLDENGELPVPKVYGVAYSA